MENIHTQAIENMTEMEVQHYFQDVSPINTSEAEEAIQEYYGDDIPYGFVTGDDGTPSDWFVETYG